MTEGRVWGKKRWLFVGIVILLLIALGLTVVIIIMNNVKQEQESEEISFVLPEELLGDDLSPIDQITKETTIMNSNPDYSKQDIENYYDTAIGKAMTSGDTGFAARIIIQKIQFVAVIEEDCARAVEYIGSIDLAEFSVETRAYLASYIVSIADYCEDQTLADNWQRFANGGFNE